MNRILITGGTGLIGKHLTTLLLAKGYTVYHLSRSAGSHARVNTFVWDVEKGEIDERCIEGVDTIIHLAGAGIADKRWTDKRKKLIIESRTQSIRLLYSLLKRKPHTVKSVISASGIGYYSDRADELMFEDSAPNNDFLAVSCIKWENAVDEGAELGLRVVKFRTGVVLDTGGGALPKLALPVKFGVGAALGSGRQWLSWIHWHDAVAMYIFAIEHNIAGVYNMVAPNPVTNNQLIKEIAKTLKRPLWLPNVPAFALKAALGELATAVLGSTKVSSQKIEKAGFKFEFIDVSAALKDIHGK
ncbi:TIGR01777 family protein [Mucilaginibacter hurinus]|uniref:TIGR01777 family protein n=1 Tax=Mucilaginibacter hurinus TaxID=2201324 RepID=A0A367GP87_9SPHI|nr:TIGR01777 family oxidoreductase [Mucilaginibacter hurinus]RCH54865.1 TIGR01777 family protein [Mucilaginibacter hurinus]